MVKDFLWGSTEYKRLPVVVLPISCDGGWRRTHDFHLLVQYTRQLQSAENFAVFLCNVRCESFLDSLLTPQVSTETWAERESVYCHQHSFVLKAFKYSYATLNKRCALLHTLGQGDALNIMRYTHKHKFVTFLYIRLYNHELFITTFIFLEKSNHQWHHSEIYTYIYISLFPNPKYGLKYKSVEDETLLTLSPQLSSISAMYAHPMECNTSWIMGWEMFRGGQTQLLLPLTSEDSLGWPL